MGDAKKIQRCLLLGWLDQAVDNDFKRCSVVQLLRKGGSVLFCFGRLCKEQTYEDVEPGYLDADRFSPGLEWHLCLLQGVGEFQAVGPLSGKRIVTASAAPHSTMAEAYLKEQKPALSCTEHGDQCV